MCISGYDTGVRAAIDYSMKLVGSTASTEAMTRANTHLIVPEAKGAAELGGACLRACPASLCVSEHRPLTPHPRARLGRRKVQALQAVWRAARDRRVARRLHRTGKAAARGQVRAAPAARSCRDLDCAAAGCCHDCAAAGRILDNTAAPDDRHAAATLNSHQANARGRGR